ncbi:hypothetical protein ACH5RR_041417 [Cinchona calisaya]|uniref:KIB1-4 beta-propeller domain-containing protein n=1 Tax=Cinchona calisaya TaxID=153742 RepID=A0ABD2XYY1_9GENT
MVDVEKQTIPWLMISHGKGEDRLTSFSIIKNRYYSKRIIEMQKKYVWSCSFGWWIVNDFHTGDCFLFHPHNLEKIQLPPLEPICPIDSCWDVCILTAPPNDPQCDVLFVYIDEDSFAYFCQPGDEEFVKQKLDGQLQSATTIGETVYGKVNGSELMDWESNWIELDTTGDQVIFLSQGCCTSSSAVDQEMDGNQVYFTEARNLFNFNVRDGSITSLVPCPTASPDKSFSSWVLMPPDKYLGEE